MQPTKPKRRRTETAENSRNLLSMELPEEISKAFNAITDAHPFSRTKLGLLALQIALPELQRRYPPAPGPSTGLGNDASR